MSARMVPYAGAEPDYVPPPRFVPLIERIERGQKRGWTLRRIATHEGVPLADVHRAVVSYLERR